MDKICKTENASYDRVSLYSGMRDIIFIAIYSDIEWFLRAMHTVLIVLHNALGIYPSGTCTWSQNSLVHNSTCDIHLYQLIN